MTQTYTDADLKIMATALPLVEAVPMAQDECWPGDGPAHDDHCKLADHSASAAAVAATEGLSWDFYSWSATARWFHRALEASRTAEIIWDRDHGTENEGYYVRLHGKDIEDVQLDSTTADDARAEVEIMYPTVEITRCDQPGTKMEHDIIVVSHAIEIHPASAGYAVVRNGSVYGSYQDLDYARQVAEDLAAYYEE